MKTVEIVIASKEFYKFVESLLGTKVSEDKVMIEDLDSIEIKFRYVDEENFPGIEITSYKANGSWSDIKVHVKPRVVNEYTLTSK